MLVRRRGPLWVLAALLFLGGAVGVAFLQIRHEHDRADGLAAEAGLRGTAVSTLAGDVRALRAQVQAAGKTPVAPDPTAAVGNLPARTEVPVPIPGPPGPKGDKGDTGAAASPVPGPSGPAGVPGADSIVPGPVGSPGAAGAQGEPGPAGVDGQDGIDGQDGSNGQPPAGWTWTDPAGQTYTCTPAAGFDPSAPRYTCAPDSAGPTSSPSPTGSDSGLLSLGLLASTSVYRRLP